MECKTMLKKMKTKQKKKMVSAGNIMNGYEWVNGRTDRTSSIVSSTSTLTGWREHRLAGTKAAPLSPLEAQPSCCSGPAHSWVSSPSSSLYSDWEALRVMSLGLLGSWTDGVFPIFFAGHLFLGRGADGSLGEAGVASEGDECASSLVG